MKIGKFLAKGYQFRQVYEGYDWEGLHLVTQDERRAIHTAPRPSMKLDLLTHDVTGVRELAPAPERHQGGDAFAKNYRSKVPNVNPLL